MEQLLIELLPPRVTYADCVSPSNRIGENNDCTVKAVAIACAVSYETAHAKMAELGRRKGKGTHSSKYIQACEDLGFTVTTLRGWVSSTGEKARMKAAGKKRMHEWVEDNVKAKTVRTLARELTEGSYIVRVRGHALAIVDGKVEDWTGDASLRRVTDIWKIS